MKKIFTIFMGMVAVLLLAACSGPTEQVEPSTELSSQWSDALTLQSVEYENRDFLRDGIGIVNYIACVDGDTSIFQSINGGRQLRVRYVGIDTAESTSRVEPWGMPATQYVCDILDNAELIVLEMDPAAGRLDNFGRDLAYVWVDGKLLNLMIVEQAFSPAVGAAILKYGDAFIAAQEHARNTRRRIWGETDPGFIGEPIDVTIDELLANLEEFSNRFINVTGVVTNRVDGNFYLGNEEDDIYVFARNSIPAIVINEFDKGKTLRLNNVYLTKFSGRWQLTNFLIDNVEILD
jgi:micrococcal nuclease